MYQLEILLITQGASPQSRTLDWTTTGKSGTVLAYRGSTVDKAALPRSRFLRAAGRRSKAYLRISKELPQPAVHESRLLTYPCEFLSRGESTPSHHEAEKGENKNAPLLGTVEVTTTSHDLAIVVLSTVTLAKLLS
jgi:hypothetical protein